MAFGIIKINNEKRAIAELEAEIARYNQLIETEKDTYEARSSLYWIRTRAFELGYVLDDSINLG
jgi:peptidoglycan hydrolase CwlO-like protein